MKALCAAVKRQMTLVGPRFLIILVTLSSFTLSPASSSHADASSVANIEGIPFISQYPQGWTRTQDCGPTTVAMILDFYKQRPPDLAGANNDEAFITQIRQKATGVLADQDFTFPQMEAAVSAYNVEYDTMPSAGDSWSAETAVTAMQGAINFGDTVIALIHGDDLNRTYTVSPHVDYGDHFVVVKGFSADLGVVYLNDPDQRTPAQLQNAQASSNWINGGQISIGTTLFTKALADAHTNQGGGPYALTITGLSSYSPVGSNWSVNLTADQTQAPLGTVVNLTAQSSQDVGPTPYIIDIVDVTTGEAEGYCTQGTTCTAQVSDCRRGTAGTTCLAESDTYIARVETPLQVVSAPVVVTWSANISPPYQFGGLNVSVGYADSLRANPNLPVPWAGSPNTVFIGDAQDTFDDGAIRLDNTTANPITVQDVSVSIHNPGESFDLWQPFTIPPGDKAIVAQTAFQNFDTSDFPVQGSEIGATCSQPAAGSNSPPQITITLADGSHQTFSDTGHILDTGGIDSAYCNPDGTANSDGSNNESLQWRPVGTTGSTTQGGSFTLSPSSGQTGGGPLTAATGTQFTLTANLMDASGLLPLSDVALNFTVVSGPNAGLTGQAVTDDSGDASFSYTSAAAGTDVIEASAPNASGGSFTSNPVSVTWTLANCPHQTGQSCTAIWLDRSTYNVGDIGTICYNVPQPAFVVFTSYLNDGSSHLVTEGYDDGTGGCFQGQFTTARSGRLHLAVYTDSSESTLLGQDDAYFTVNPVPGTVTAITSTDLGTITPGPTETPSPVPPTPTATRTAMPRPMPPTRTPTPSPATNTPAPPPPTNAPVPPVPTNTPVPPPAATATNAPAPPVETNTVAPPAATATPTSPTGLNALAPPTSTTVPLSAGQPPIHSVRSVARKQSTHTTALPLTIVLSSHNVRSGGVLTIRIHTAPRSRVTAVLEVVTKKVIVTGKGRHRKRTVKTTVLYRVRLHGTADVHGQLTERIRIAYRPARTVQARLTGLAQLARRSATRTSWVLIRPQLRPSHHRQKVQPQHHGHK